MYNADTDAEAKPSLKTNTNPSSSSFCLCSWFLPLFVRFPNKVSGSGSFVYFENEAFFMIKVVRREIRQ